MLLTGFSLGLFQRALCPLGPLWGYPKTNNVPNGSTPNQHIVIHLNYVLELENCLGFEYRA